MWSQQLYWDHTRAGKVGQSESCEGPVITPTKPNLLGTYPGNISTSEACTRRSIWTFCRNIFILCSVAIHVTFVLSCYFIKPSWNIYQCSVRSVHCESYLKVVKRKPPPRKSPLKRVFTGSSAEEIHITPPWNKKKLKKRQDIYVQKANAGDRNHLSLSLCKSSVSMQWSTLWGRGKLLHM